MAQEREVKFYLSDLDQIQKRLLSVGAEIIKPRVFEKNLRFDLPDRSFDKAGRVLRLRQDNLAHLTYKNRATNNNGVSEREELEVVVDDFDTTKALLIALGYEISIQYEKYRTTYQLRNLEIVLDELPYGLFLEIEGPDATAIRGAAEELGLNWQARTMLSYVKLFEKLRANGLKAEHLTFDALDGKSFSAADFGLIPAEKDFQQAKNQLDL